MREQDRRPQLMTDDGTGDNVALSSGNLAVSPLGQMPSPPPPGNLSPTLQPLGATASVGSAGSRGGGGGPGRGGLHSAPQKRTGGGIQVGEHTGFLRMRGLPFSASKEDISTFFEGYNAIPESVVLVYRNDGRATGEAYVGFSSPEDSKRAMELHRRTMGSRYIELFISNKDEHGRALARFGNR
jgi:heterogeneous nuclear ribonucleoprotein F/H